MVTKLQLLLSGTVIPVYKLTVEKQEKRAADKCVFEVKRTQSVTIGNDVKVRTVEATPKYLFSGRVYEIDEEYDKKKVTALSYAAVIDEVRVFPSRYYANKYPEEIAQDLIRLVGLTWGSNWSSGVTLASYEAVGTVGENIRRLAKAAGADFWTATDSTGTIKFYFQPASLTNLGVTLRLSGSGANAKRIDHNPSSTEIVNAAEVWGRTKQTLERYTFIFNSPFGPNWNFSLARPLSGVRVSAKGVQLAEGANNDFYYRALEPIVNQPVVTIIPQIQGSSDNPVDIVIEGMMDSSSLAYAENSASISTYGKRMKAYIVENLEDESDLQSLAEKIVNLYGSPRRTLSAQIPGIRSDIVDGGKLVVYDPLIGISNQEFIVRKVVWKYPEGVTEVELGQFLPDIYEFEREFPSLVESAGRSSWMSSYKYVARRLYLGGDGTVNYPYTLAFGLKDAKASSATRYLGNPPYVDVSLDMQIIGQYTRTYQKICPTRIYPSAATQTIYLSPGYSLVTDYVSYKNYLNADASGNLQIKVQFFIRIPPSNAWDLWAPVPTDSTKYFTTTVSGIKRLLPTDFGGMLVVKVDTTVDFAAVLYWGQASSFGSVSGSHLFNLGFEVA